MTAALQRILPRPHGRRDPGQAARPRRRVGAEPSIRGGVPRLRSAQPARGSVVVAPHVRRARARARTVARNPPRDRSASSRPRGHDRPRSPRELRARGRARDVRRRGDRGARRARRARDVGQRGRGRRRAFLLGPQRDAAHRPRGRHGRILAGARDRRHGRRPDRRRHAHPRRHGLGAAESIRPDCSPRARRSAHSV